MALHLELGRKGESLAKTFLENAGYEILDENWTHGKAEIDLVAYKDKVIIFAEVKTRSGTGFGQPEDFVDSRKQKLLADAAGSGDEVAKITSAAMNGGESSAVKFPTTIYRLQIGAKPLSN